MAKPLDPPELEALAQRFAKAYGLVTDDAIDRIRDVLRANPVGDPYHLLDDAAWAAAVEEHIRPVMEELVIDAAHRAATGYAFDVTDPAMAAAVDGHLEQIIRWSSDLRNEVGDVIADGIRAGDGVEAMAGQLRERVPTLDPKRALTIARTEANSAANAGTMEGWRASGTVARKAWLSTSDSRTRESHAEANGQTVGLDDDFAVGSGLGAYPGDPRLPLSERVGCRCTLLSVEADEPAVAATAGPQRRTGRPVDIGTATVGFTSSPARTAAFIARARLAALAQKQARRVELNRVASWAAAERGRLQLTVARALVAAPAEHRAELRAMSTELRAMGSYLNRFRRESGR